MSRLAVTTDIDWFTEMVVGGQRTVNQLVADLTRSCVGATTADSLGPIVYRLATDSDVQVKPCGEPWLIPDADHCVITPELEDPHQQ